MTSLKKIHLEGTTFRQLDGHRDSMTNSAQMAELVKIGLENIHMNTNLMKSELCSGSKFVSTHNTSTCWSLVKKTRPKHLPTVPVGKINSEGKMITDQEGLKKLYLEMFLWRLRDRPIRPDLVELQDIKVGLLKSILKTWTKKKTSPWT